MTKWLRSEIVFSACMVAAVPCLGSQDEVEALRQLERRLADAWVKSDRATIDGLLSDDWTVIDIAGQRRTKEQVFHDMFGPDGPQITDMRVDELEVRTLGEVAVVTGRTIATSDSGMTVTLRFTDVVVRRNGTWQFVSSQGTRVEQ